MTQHDQPPDLRDYLAEAEAVVSRSPRGGRGLKPVAAYRLRKE